MTDLAIAFAITTGKSTSEIKSTSHQSISPLAYDYVLQGVLDETTRQLEKGF